MDRSGSIARLTRDFAAVLPIDFAINYPVPAGAAAMGTKDMVMLRLRALETGERPKVHLRTGRLATSALAVAVLLGAGAWLPRRPHVVVLTPHVVGPPPVGSLGPRAAHTQP